MEIYVKEMPKSCRECPCSFKDYATFKWCNAYEKGKLTFISDDIYKEKRFEDCPLKLLKDHDKELVEKVLRKAKSLITKYDLLKSYNSCAGYYMLDKIIDQIQKEFEDE